MTGEVFENAQEAMAAKIEREKEERANKNPPFIQLTKGVSPDVIAKIAGESSTAIQVLMFFFKNMDDHNVIMVSQKVIADTINKTTRAVTNGIKVLEKHGAVGIAKVSNANIYIINPEVAWQKAFKQRSIVKMKAVILLGKEENEKLFSRFSDVHKTSVENSLKVDSVSTKIAKNKNQTSLKAGSADQDLDEAQAFYEEFEENLEHEDKDF
ncbi:hypothetical protein D4905_15615 [Listeria monocytogenes]|nr:hypothetical protein [Listeria monocytogenes]